MTTYATLTSTLFRTRLREPVGLFFSFIFAPSLVLILGLIFGNEPNPNFGGLGYIDATLPAFASVVVTLTGVLILPVNQLILRESGALRRLRLTPLRPAVFLAADLTVNFVVGLIGIAAALAVGILIFGVTLQGSTIGVLLAAALGLVAFLSLGYALSGLYPSSGAATGVGNVLMILLMLTSGAFVPLAVMPEGVRTVMEFSPVRYFVRLIEGLWLGGAWSELLVPAAVLVGMTVVFGLLGTLLFRWDDV
ncbi:ABC transporter permease [Corynebacterium halotolerans]|uniref:Transport permease protein n=1 Tax=Corynebacterium halotolerans YIM 70093 = DSM 44683 TaxID=1121362 RepID=M1P458_9CORY|nr:ABC transporter permease [Corynebacterium halotolerans]AGF71431.1 putative integral membrane protein [Corynebacterium halotolerans YIM 70093 = DSM 44683]